MFQILCRRCISKSAKSSMRCKHNISIRYQIYCVRVMAVLFFTKQRPLLALRDVFFGRRKKALMGRRFQQPARDDYCQLTTEVYEEHIQCDSMLGDWSGCRSQYQFSCNRPLAGFCSTSLMYINPVRASRCCS
jgi:hypothetical protein